MRYFIIAGEQSGDLHGSNLVRELISADPQADIACWGGDLMEAAGAKLLMHYKKSAFMGFAPVLLNLKTITRNLRLCKQQISDFSPDVVVFIDYPGFNMRIARFARESGFRTFYYISPKFWAWNEKRVEKVKKYIDRMYIIFPFETEFYKKHGITVEYRGNPLLDETDKKLIALPGSDEIRKELGTGEKPVIALLAGSRKHEVEFILPAMVGVVKDFPDYQFVLAGVKNLPDDLYTGIIREKNIIILKDKTYEVLRIAEAALVASGTATLETALFHVPQVVCYRGDFLSMLIAWLVIKVRYISLVNLILDSEVVKEVLGYNVNSRNLAAELKKILRGEPGREKMLLEYRALREKLGPTGASGRIARDMVNILNNKGS